MHSIDDLEKHSINLKLLTEKLENTFDRFSEDVDDARTLVNKFDAYMKALKAEIEVDKNNG